MELGESMIQLMYCDKKKKIPVIDFYSEGRKNYC